MKHKIINLLSLYIPQTVRSLAWQIGAHYSTIRRALNGMIAEGVVVRFQSFPGTPYKYCLNGNCRFSTLELYGYHVKLAATH
jgi:predicted transcriptional regulator